MIEKKRGEREAAERWGSDTNNRPALGHLSAACDEINSAYKGGASAAFCAPLRRWQRLISLVLRWGGLIRGRGATLRRHRRPRSGSFRNFSCFPKQVDVMARVRLVI